MDRKESKKRPISKAKTEIARQCQYDQMVKNRNEDAYRRFKAKPYQMESREHSMKCMNQECPYHSKDNECPAANGCGGHQEN